MTALNIPSKEIDRAYTNGIEARRLNKPKIVPFSINTHKDICLKYWWLAGWNDADIGLRNGSQDE